MRILRDAPYWTTILIMLGAVTVTAQTASTVRVKCNQGQSINNALKHHTNAQNLVVEIEGMCNENVVVTRDRVTLRGTDPANDGIQAVANEIQIDAALWVRGVHQFVVENLKLTGGFTGLLATEVTTPFLIMRNCRLETNNTFGVTLEASLLQAKDTVFDSNGSFNAGVFLGSRFGCDGCTLSNPGGGVGPTVRTNLLMLTGSSAVVGNTTFSNGGVALNNSSAVIFDSSIDTFAPNASLAASEGILSLTRVQIGGPMRLFQGSNVTLFGVTQTRSETPNSIDDNSFLKIGDAPPSTGGPPSIASVILDLSLRNFSNASLLQTSQINGNLNCSQGANTFCGNPANVSGTSNCALCPKP